MTDLTLTVLFHGEHVIHESSPPTPFFLLLPMNTSVLPSRCSFCLPWFILSSGFLVRDQGLVKMDVPSGRSSPIICLLSVYCVNNNKNVFVYIWPMYPQNDQWTCCLVLKQRNNMN